MCGIHAEVFSVGMGPKIYSWQDKRGTVWQIAAIPLGGYVKFLCDINISSIASDMSHENNTFNNASLKSKALTVLAGPVANFYYHASFLLHYFYGIGNPQMNQ